MQAGCASSPRYRARPVHRPVEKPGEEKPKPQTGTSKQGSASLPGISTKGAYQVGYASYYAHDFNGKPTASGEIFDMNGLTAAHRELPLGTIIRVTNLNNGRSVIVKVNDRGPFVEGRILDLSLGAARRLDMVKDGVVKVKIEILKTVN